MWLAIINPRAGRPLSTSGCEALARRVSAALGADVVFTQRPGHARELAAEAHGYEALAVYGGDGTVADVVNGMDLERQRLLLLGGGTGNGLARDLKLTSLEAGLAAARGQRLRRLDLIRVTGQVQGEARSRLAISTASVGYAAETVVLANRRFKPFGPLCYPLAATVQALRQPDFALSVSVDGGAAAPRRASNVMVNNTRHAGNFSAFRGADLADGQFVLLLARAGFGGQLLHNLAVLTRTYFYATAAERNARSVTVELPTPRRLMLDGEIWDGVTRVCFEALPGRLRCVA